MIPQFNPLGTFNPLSLFASGAPGYLYQDSDLSTLLTGASPSTPAALEDPITLQLDKSQGLALGTELIGNPGPFAATTGWAGQDNVTLSVSGGNLVSTVSGSSNTLSYYDITTVAGTWYKETVVTQCSAAALTLKLQAYNGPFTTQLVDAQTTTTGNSQTLSVYFLATGTSTRIGFAPSTACTFTTSSASTKKIAGNHRYSSGANRPKLSALYNLLTKTEKFDDAYWTKNASSISIGGTAPDGTNTANKLIESATTANHNITGASIITSGVATTITVSAKPAERPW